MTEGQQLPATGAEGVVSIDPMDAAKTAVAHQSWAQAPELGAPSATAFGEPATQKLASSEEMPVEVATAPAEVVSADASEPTIGEPVANTPAAEGPEDVLDETGVEDADVSDDAVGKGDDNAMSSTPPENAAPIADSFDSRKGPIIEDSGMGTWTGDDDMLKATPTATPSTAETLTTTVIPEVPQTEATPTAILASETTTPTSTTEVPTTTPLPTSPHGGF